VGPTAAFWGSRVTPIGVNWRRKASDVVLGGRRGNCRAEDEMKRVLLGGYVHEGHSFVGGHTDLDDFRGTGYLVEGDQLLGLSYVRNGELNGIVDALRESVEFIPSIHGWANSGPPLTGATYEYFERKILAAIRGADALDAVALVLHGSSLVDGIDDPEGRLLQAVRHEVGPSVPVVATFDLHANVTQARVDAATAIVGYTTCPHTDLYDTGVRAASILLRAARGDVAPVGALRKLPMITAAPAHDTNHGPVVPVMALARQLEGLPSVLAVSVFLAQPWLDLPDLGNSVCVITDGRPELGQGLADDVAAMLWERRHEFLWRGTPVEEAIKDVLLSPPGMVALADGADSPTSGSSGDGNDLLRALVDTGFAQSALLTVVDAAAVELAFAAGPGAEINVALGGSLTPSYTPLEVAAVVESLYDGKYWLEIQPRPVDIGRIALLRIGSISVVVSERKPFMLDASVFHHVGLDPRDFRVVQVKSGGGFRAAFEPFAARIIDLETSGPSSSDFSRLPFRRLSGPIWPLDRSATMPRLNAPGRGRLD